MTKKPGTCRIVPPGKRRRTDKEDLDEDSDKSKRKRLRKFTSQHHNPQDEPSKQSPCAIQNGPVKRQRSSIEDVSLSNHQSKRHKDSQSSRKDLVWNWLHESQIHSIDSAETPRKGSDIMSRQCTNIPPPSNSIPKSSSSSKSSGKSTASVHDPNYRESLRHHNIYIEIKEPPPGLMHNAQEIILGLRKSPEIDDGIAQEIRATVRRVQVYGEENIIQELIPLIIPAIHKSFQSLARNANQRWYKSVPVSLNSDVLSKPLPLPKPKPDLSIGYSQTAFNSKQLETIDLLVDELSGLSYAIPDDKNILPFLGMEFKSQAKGGTLHVATNQVAGTGAIALNGFLELISRSNGLESLDLNVPQYFSVTMDHTVACLQVHWVSIPAERGQPSFHVEELSQYFLKKADDVRAFRRAIKNILDYGSDTRLKQVHNAIEVYRERVITARKTVTTPQRDSVQTWPQPKRGLGPPQGGSKRWRRRSPSQSNQPEVPKDVEEYRNHSAPRRRQPWRVVRKGGKAERV